MYPMAMRIATVAATVAAVGALLTAPAWATETEESTSPLEFNNWAVSGYLHDKKANQTITLPQGSAFNGSGEIVIKVVNEGAGWHLAGVAGNIAGSIFVPNFSAPLTLAGNSTPITTGLSFTQVGTSEGTFIPNPAAPPEDGAVILTVVSKANLGITEVGLLGIETPVTCTTSEPVTFNLVDDTTVNEMLTVGAHFTGTVTLPSFSCGGLQGAAVSPVVSALLSGPENPYSLRIIPPEA